MWRSLLEQAAQWALPMSSDDAEGGIANADKVGLIYRQSGQ